MSQRPLNIRPSMLAGLALSVFLVVLSTLQAPPDDRVSSFVLTAVACGVALALVFAVATAVQARRSR